MKYTWRVECLNEVEGGKQWQALDPPVTVDFDGTAQQVADEVAAQQHQKLGDAADWCVRVWEGPEVDDTVLPAAEYHPPHGTVAKANS